MNYLFTGIGVFQGDRLIGWIEESKSKAFTYISNRVSSTVASVSCPNSKGKFAFEVIHNNVKIIPKIKTTSR
ncbi:Ger(x)C family spore germination C-terminal domain-containing protein [Paenibacillus amylolyticus]|nr:Ger(x)C family spore germination C-terminal domain-containing protein [Paenibacillus amylolyticus]